MFIGCDGIFDRLSTKEVVKIVWDSLNNLQNEISFDSFLKKCVNEILYYSLIKRSLDNVSGILISFNSFYLSFLHRISALKEPILPLNMILFGKELLSLKKRQYEKDKTEIERLRKEKIREKEKAKIKEKEKKIQKQKFKNLSGGMMPIIIKKSTDDENISKIYLKNDF